MDYLVYAALTLSVLINAILGYRFYKKEYVVTKDAQKVLSELLAGPAVLKIEILNATNLFLRSPRG